MPENQKENQNHLTSMKLTIDTYIIWTGKGFIFTLKGIEVPYELQNNEVEIPKEHITINMKKLIDENNIKDLPVEDIFSLISFHKTQNENKDDTRTPTERHTDEVVLMDVFDQLKESLPEELLDKNKNIDELQVSDIYFALSEWQEVFKSGERPFITENSDNENDEEEEYIPDMKISDFLNKVTTSPKELFSYDTEVISPGKKWRFSITLDFEKYLFFGFEVVKTIDDPDIQDLSWDEFKEEFLRQIDAKETIK